MSTNLVSELGQFLEIDLPVTIQLEELKDKLSAYINHLIQSDFEKLVSLLYRIDVSEAKLKYLLRQHPGEDASQLIAELIIERQLQKIKSRRQFKQRDDTISDDDKW